MKKKTGHQTPEYRRHTAPPQPTVPPMPQVTKPKQPNKDCTYETPCGWCTKWDKKCDLKIPMEHNNGLAWTPIYDDGANYGFRKGEIVMKQTVISLKKIKSHLKIGDMVIHNTHHFNWFHRIMWKLFFGFEIENIKEKPNEEM